MGVPGTPKEPKKSRCELSEFIIVATDRRCLRDFDTVIVALPHNCVFCEFAYSHSPAKQSTVWLIFSEFTLYGGAPFGTLPGNKLRHVLITDASNK